VEKLYSHNDIKELEKRLALTIAQWKKELSHNTEASPRSSHPLIIPSVIEQTMLIGWAKEEIILEKFHHESISRGFIEKCDYTIFRSHFFTTQFANLELLQWKLSNEKLVYLFYKLNAYCAIAHEHTLHTILPQHFLNRRKKPLRSKSVKATLCTIRKGAPDRHIDSFLELVFGK